MRKYLILFERKLLYIFTTSSILNVCKLSFIFIMLSKYPVGRHVSCTRIKNMYLDTFPVCHLAGVMGKLSGITIKAFKCVTIWARLGTDTVNRNRVTYTLGDNAPSKYSICLPNLQGREVQKPQS